MVVPVQAFIGTKLILATPMTRRDYSLYRGWELPQDENGDAAEHAVSELATHISGALSPFGDTEFPLPFSARTLCASIASKPSSASWVSRW